MNERNSNMPARIKNHKELRVYENGFTTAMEIFQRTKKFPPEEKFNLTDQIRRSSRSVCTNIAEAWRKRRYKAAFIAKLSDAETEACETQVHAQFAHACGYIDGAMAAEWEEQYERILAQMVVMINNPEQWIITSKRWRKEIGMSG
jgi:four helix bundle protein